MSRHSRSSVLLALTALVGFRLLYGLSMPFWFEDERQVYLIGLQSFAHQEWPYFGADVVWTGGRLPGALLGWLIRLPLAIWPAPEAPFILLNVLSGASLSLLAWYIGRRLPRLPRWLIWTTLFTLPWTLNFSTHIVNPSFALAGAIVFFVGFFESMPSLRRGILSVALAWSMMGFGLLWVMQLHLSWVLLLPYALAAVLWSSRGGTRVAVPIAAFLAGAALPGVLLIPTLTAYGWDAGHGQGAVTFHWLSPLEVITMTARVLSFASFEITRFMGLSTAERAFAILRSPLIGAAAMPVLVAGLVHPLWMAASAFRRSPDAAADWTAVRALFAGTILLIFVSYFYSIRGPQAHAFSVVFPVAALFAFTCWDARVSPASRLMPRIALVVIVSNIVLHAALGLDRLSRQSLYADRTLVAAAITDRNDRYLGERRGAGQEIRATDDLQLVQQTWRPWRGFSRFDLTIRNTSQTTAWLDIRLATTYLDQTGMTVASREVVVKQILEPGESRTWTDIADDRVPEFAVSAALRIVAAERVAPTQRRDGER
ncbi:MAG TPA: hypothetical protein VN700_15145 [Vicinamibacterales bacterium]|nr:hypothetical protein [Vicinamibacterales bacterium]